tara:strand:- start:160 stop:276 length:117 start_codon:yes stop_codon:yes gene_type:complete
MEKSEIAGLEKGTVDRLQEMNMAMIAMQQKNQAENEMS